MEFESGNCDDREERFQDLLVRYVEAAEEGHAFQPKEFAARYPEFAVELEEYFAGLRQLDRIAAPLRGLVQPSVARHLGDFRLLRELGRGGMGIVYEADQLSLNRRVALKVLPFVATLDLKQLQRFRNEAQAAAHLHHQNIVPVYAVGCERGVHYFAMQYIEGQSLDVLLRELRQREGLEGDQEPPPANRSPQAPSHTPVEQPASAAAESTLPRADSGSATARGLMSAEGSLGKSDYFRMVAGLGIQAAEALEHAHEQGIVHRDIKPANLLLDARGHLWVTDFGLAHSQADVGLTVTGDVVGTVRYMSPEQAQAKCALVDHRTDIYSLGATLYELLTLRPAFSATDRHELFRQIALEEPRSPSRVRKGVPGDLETIVLKAMAKELQSRYTSARELAEDLSRFLTSRPILARRPTVAHRLHKWLGRHKALTALVVGFFVLATVGLAISTIMIWREEGRTSQALADARANQRGAEEQKVLAETRARLARRYLYAADLNLAYQAWYARQPARAWQQLQRHRPKALEEDLRSFEWYHLQNECRRGLYRTLRSHTGPVAALAYAPDGRRLASGGDDGTAWLWDTVTGQGRVLFRATNDSITSVVFSPDGKTLALGAKRGPVVLWDMVADKETARIVPQPMFLRSVAFSPDGRKVALVGGTIELWDAATAKLSGILKDPKRNFYSAAFAPDGRMLASGSNDGGVRLWKAPFEGPPKMLGGHSGYVLHLSFSADGASLATSADDGTVMVWNLATGRGEPAANMHIGSAAGVAFFPHDKRLVSWGEDGSLQLWNIGAKECLVRGVADEVDAVSLSADGQTLASGQTDGTISLWRVADMKADVLWHAQPVNSIALGRDHRTLASVGSGAENAPGYIRFWDVGAARATANWWRASKTALKGACLSPDGRLLACAGTEGTIQLWDVATHRRVGEWPGHVGAVWSSAFSPDGAMLATAGYQDHIVRLWKVPSGQPSGQLIGHKDSIWSVAFSPDGKTIASGSRDKTAMIWSLADLGQPRAVLAGHTEWVWAVQFSPDGRTLATASQDKTVKLWDTGNWQPANGSHRETEPRATLQGHGTFVRALAFFPDGTTLATGSQDHTVKLWDLESEQERATLRGHTKPVTSLAISSDGQLLISGSWDGTVRVWRAPRADASESSDTEP